MESRDVSGTVSKNHNNHFNDILGETGAKWSTFFKKKFLLLWLDISYCF